MTLDVYRGGHDRNRAAPQRAAKRHLSSLQAGAIGSVAVGRLPVMPTSWSKPRPKGVGRLSLSLLQTDRARSSAASSHSAPAAAPGAAPTCSSCASARSAAGPISRLKLRAELISPT
jgi:hypothetical protein